LIGRGNGLRKELIKIAESHHLFNRRIFFPEAVPVQNLLAYTASADAGIIPYPNLGLKKYYCTPNKLFEFIVAGLPILANDLPELNRFVSQQGIGMNLPMNSPEDIARSIDAFFSSDLKKFRIKAQQIATQYVWQIQGQKVVELYVRLVDEDRQYPSI
jgi:glycosyltransferase involved in cell wall biosynthesis